ncbi:bifunctional methylenetetrahydrofolate dehydrogenase/methenyltetrahydrofolate cyclohydrolase FolD [Francisella adeliensis]|uniref:Bifunctional protein FolD n=1 Tax=Francisella adeliensis TaxID=2007306 RepID=A0A2Z4XZM2_9GAMM|nr:bifunctional methylenetetrahydrofolate dehydrogenase/methenyltetrahydrofolate cyclohydrolase FolD [Francisella adeliensis]AXA34214.1 bifunctional methylenetetrahydrofolate dehydrogenase/methenyltetrahydrofolate cyclohydrolase [Francisella adeliensis]MBK2084855.1 bifunctional methylenetetrahydrofolate dehydrogenase/methenyltetrahydrofolate cyclohydrolase FolD [Francisella adeliensis]MBK2096314.1 bifunctional methylenetetrahydrofolate dehydrogenase/methenyltetrahydrofolate cyclohydrolase FolD [
MTLIDGKALSLKLKSQLKEQIQEYKSQTGIVPKLVAVIVGEDAASKTYVASKEKACAKVGIDSDIITLPSSTTEEELLDLIDKLNNDDSVNGILVQLPLPGHINKHKVIYKILPEKDVDGFHPANVGRLQLRDKKCLESCTPKGIMTMLREYGIDLVGANAVVVGASNIVGKPVSQLLLNAKATVTTCHRFTKNLKEITRNAEVLIVAVGKPGFITADMVKEGVVVVDVGINYVDGKICGDVDFDAVKEKAGAITPVPGGVGPMTITELLYNTFQCARDQHSNT